MKQEGKSTHPLDALLKAIVDEERQVLGRLGIEVDEVLEVRRDHLLEEAVVAERLVQEMIEAVLQVQEAL